MEENLILLGIKIKKDPLTYKEEFVSQIQIFETLSSLQSPPIKQIKPMVFFLVKHAHIEPFKTIKALLDGLENIKDYKTKKLILSGLIIVRQKKMIQSKELLNLILVHGQELRSFLKNMQEYLDLECYPVLLEWYKKGTERQKCFCYFLLLVLFSKIHSVADRKRMELESQENLSQDNISLENEVLSESNDSIFSGDSLEEESNDTFLKLKVHDNSKFDNSKNIINMEELEEIICSAFNNVNRITKICCLYFLNRTEIKFDITKLENGISHGKRLYKELTGEVIDREIKIMKIKIFVLLKEHFKIKKSIVKIVLNMIDLENDDLKDLLDCIVKSVDMREVQDVLKVISEEFIREGQLDEVVVYGLNMMRDIYAKLRNEVEEEFEEENDELEEIKNSILKYIEIFKGNRTKSIFYAYKMVLKVLVKNEDVISLVTQVKKKRTK